MKTTGNCHSIYSDTEFLCRDRGSYYAGRALTFCLFGGFNFVLPKSFPSQFVFEDRGISGSVVGTDGRFSNVLVHVSSTDLALCDVNVSDAFRGSRTSGGITLCAVVFSCRLQVLAFLFSCRLRAKMI